MSKGVITLADSNALDFIAAAAGKLSSDDVLVLPLDLLKLDSHNAAVSTVLEHFGKVCQW